MDEPTQAQVTKVTEEPKEPEETSSEAVDEAVEEKAEAKTEQPIEPSDSTTDQPKDAESTDQTDKKVESAEPPEPPADQTQDAKTSDQSIDEQTEAQTQQPAESADATDDQSSEPQVSPSPTHPAARDVKGAHWYVVHTHSGHEAKVAATLKQRVESQKLSSKVLDILVPTQEKIEIKEGKKSKVKEKIFPGYLLIRMVLDDSTWLTVRTTPGITSFVGIANRPTPLPDEEVATIQRFMTMEAPKFKAVFTVGEAIKIVDGPFSEFLGSISEIDEEKGKIKVLVSIFGRETPVELDFLQVAKL